MVRVAADSCRAAPVFRALDLEVDAEAADSAAVTAVAADVTFTGRTTVIIGATRMLRKKTGVRDMDQADGGLWTTGMRRT